MSAATTGTNAPRLKVQLIASPQFDAFEVWRASLTPLYFEATLTRPESASAFYGAIAGSHLSDSLVFKSVSTGLRSRRDALFQRRSHIDHVMVEYQLKGRRVGDFGDRNVEINPGDISILDFGRTVDYVEPDFSRISLIIPRDRLPAHLRRQDLHGLVMPTNGGPARLLADFLSILTKSAYAPSADEAVGAIDVVLTLLQHGMDDSKARHPQPEAPAAMRLLAQDHIDRHLSEPDLTPQAIAAGIGLSRATLYRLFDDESGIRDYLIDRRLDRSFNLLLHRKHANVGGIAMECGFKSEAHFSRVFRRRFGIVAREVRAVARIAGSGPALQDGGLEALGLSRAWVEGLRARQPQG